MSYYYISSDNSMLILDNAPLGNLTQYLEAMADAAYANVESVHTVQMEMNFIHQIIRGVLAVHKLQVRVAKLYASICYQANNLNIEQHVNRVKLRAELIG